MSGAYTQWGIVSSGEGGGRIASTFLSREESPGIDDRVTLLNTNRADMENLMQDADILEEYGDHITIFGPRRGVGNDFAKGEKMAEEHFDVIYDAVTERMLGADALLHVTTLGGGTGNGSIPYLIEQLSTGSNVEGERPEWVQSAVNMAFAAWPYEHEPSQQQFNAIMGLSRLLMRRDVTQNADAVLLASNTHIEKGDDSTDQYDAVNERIVTAIDLLISAGRNAERVIDAEDYIAQPSNIGVYHFTPGVATDLHYDMLDYEIMFDRAADQSFVPMDASTSRAAFAVVRAPAHLVESGEVTKSGVENAFGRWKRDKGISSAKGLSTVTLKPGRGNNVDVLLLLGGFDLNPLLDQSWAEYEETKRQFEQARKLQNDSEAAISMNEIEQLEENLTRYLEVNGSGR
jgi:cell division GTPase FtsZ